MTTVVTFTTVLYHPQLVFYIEPGKGMRCDEDPRSMLKVKVSPLQVMKAHGGLDARVHIFTATALGRGII